MKYPGLQPGLEEEILNEKIMKKADKDQKDPCWKGYEQKGMKTKGGKKVPNCVKSK